jgi:hypothetical protein
MLDWVPGYQDVSCRGGSHSQSAEHRHRQRTDGRVNAGSKQNDRQGSTKEWTAAT